MVSVGLTVHLALQVRSSSLDVVARVLLRGRRQIGEYRRGAESALVGQDLREAVGGILDLKVVRSVRDVDAARDAERAVVQNHVGLTVEDIVEEADPVRLRSRGVARERSVVDFEILTAGSNHDAAARSARAAVAVAGEDCRVYNEAADGTGEHEARTRGRAPQLQVSELEHGNHVGAAALTYAQAAGRAARSR